MINDAVLPGETLVMTGDRLEAAHLKVWAGDRTLTDVEPLRAVDDRMQAVLPPGLAVSTLLIWPVRDGRVGAPIRVNGAVSSWGWPIRAEARRTGQTVRIFGKNLKLGGHEPRMYLRGPGVAAWLEVVVSNSYVLEGRLPEDLALGRHEVWAHNGSGGAFGWSEAVGFEVVATAGPRTPMDFPVEKFGAKADDDLDDAEAVAAALQAAAKAGGGVVRFAAGTYRFSRPIAVTASGEGGIQLIGAGMGGHRWRNEPVPNDHKVIHEITGAATVIKPLPHRPAPKYLVEISRRHTVIKGLTLLTEADAGKQGCLWIGAHDVRVDGVRGIVVDGRPRFAGWDKPESEVTMAEFKSRLQDEAVLRLDAPGDANIVIENSEFHHPGGGIDTPPMTGILAHDPKSGPCPPGTDYIRISNCVFRGYFDGRLEPVDKARRFQAFRGWGNMAWLNNGSKQVIVERCDFAGADKQGFKVLTRSLNHKNTAIRNVYLAHNRGHELAPTSRTPGYHENKGEQFIFHLWYPQGGLFDVARADASSVVFNPNLPKYASTPRHPVVAFRGTEYSVVPKDIDVNPGNWIVFVCAGRGVGQYREVRRCDRQPGEVTLELDRAWRVIPDETSRFVLTAAYRRIVIHGNSLDGGVNDPLVKSHGVTFWAVAFENIVDGNTFSNLSGGVVINTFYRAPTAWNLTRNNRMFRIHGNGGDTVFPGRAAFYVDHIRVLDPPLADRVWYSVGNIFRGNECHDGDTIAFLHRPDYAWLDKNNPSLPPATRELLLMPRGDNQVINYAYPATPDGGLMMSVLENNRFAHVRRGFVVSSPLNWLLLRNNEIQGLDGQPAMVDETRLGGRNDGAREVLEVKASR